MAVSLTSPPLPVSFSGDKITAGFTCSEIYDQVGVTAVNTIPLPTVIIPGDEIPIAYGSIQITMTAASIPDDSGDQFLANTTGTISAETRAAYFRSNYFLTRDFNISVVGSDMILTAKKTGIGYNITGYNTVPGATELIKPNYGLQFRLFCENANNDGYELVNEVPITVSFLSEVTAEAIIGDSLHNFITAELMNNLPDVPEILPIICKKSCRKYYFEFAEVYGEPIKIHKLFQSPVYTVIHGAMSYIGSVTKPISSLLFVDGGPKHRFLKQDSSISLTRSNQLQYLYYFNPEETYSANLMCRLRFTDNSKTLILLSTLTIESKRKYAFNVGYENVYVPGDHGNKDLLGYEIWLSDSENQRISETHTYLMDYRPLEFIRYFLSWSSLGSFDSRMFYGKGSMELEVVQSEAKRQELTPGDIRKGTSLIYDISITTKLTVSTGFLRDHAALISNRDFFLSALKFRVVGANLLPIKNTSKTIPEIQDGNNLSAQSFEYEYLFEDMAYTEGDVQEPGLIIANWNSGFSNIYLTDKERVFLASTINHDLITV